MDTFWAMGKTKIAVKLLIIYTVVNWATSVPLVYRYGFIGAMIGSVIVLWISLPLTWYYMRKLVKIDLVKPIAPVFLASILAGLLTFYLSSKARDFLSLILVLFAGGMTYLISLSLIDYHQLKADLVWFYQKIKP
jgi:O-antigen/teichoic acid export membrane protein